MAWPESELWVTTWAAGCKHNRAKGRYVGPDAARLKPAAIWMQAGRAKSLAIAPVGAMKSR